MNLKLSDMNVNSRIYDENAGPTSLKGGGNKFDTPGPVLKKGSININKNNNSNIKGGKTLSNNLHRKVLTDVSNFNNNTNNNNNEENNENKACQTKGLGEGLFPSSMKKSKLTNNSNSNKVNLPKQNLQAKIFKDNYGIFSDIKQRENSIKTRKSLSKNKQEKTSSYTNTIQTHTFFGEDISVKTRLVEASRTNGLSHDCDIEYMAPSMFSSVGVGGGGSYLMQHLQMTTELDDIFNDRITTGNNDVGKLCTDNNHCLDVISIDSMDVIDDNNNFISANNITTASTNNSYVADLNISLDLSDFEVDIS